MDIVELLRKQAAEIAGKGINGWGNTMLDAAREIESLREEAAQHSVQSDFAVCTCEIPITGGDDIRPICRKCGKPQSR